MVTWSVGIYVLKMARTFNAPKGRNRSMSSPGALKHVLTQYVHGPSFMPSGTYLQTREIMKQFAMWRALRKLSNNLSFEKKDIKKPY